MNFIDRKYTQQIARQTAINLVLSMNFHVRYNLRSTILGAMSQ